MTFGTPANFISAIGNEQGQALVEYTLILALVSLVGITVLQLVGQDITDLLGRVTSALVSALPKG
jgi:Flp pilus assembly pilin Flp